MPCVGSGIKHPPGSTRLAVEPHSIFKIAVHDDARVDKEIENAARWKFRKPRDLRHLRQVDLAQKRQRDIAAIDGDMRPIEPGRQDGATAKESPEYLRRA